MVMVMKDFLLAGLKQVQTQKHIYMYMHLQKIRDGQQVFRALIQI